jgi:hypothetical protein
MLILTVISVIWLQWYSWIPLALVTFLGPEVYAVLKEPSGTPPLTSIIRRYVKSWASFLLFGFLIFGIPTYWAWGPTSGLACGVVGGLAFWWLEHFTSTHFQIKHRSRR